ncbi:MAG: hypothetical protein MZU84_06265 [Sphingobacterium sp.]|nr:hypothetical protein [Sphingobacterium sp.]
MVEVLHQEARGREDAGADHVGDDDVGQREEAELALEAVGGGGGGVRGGGRFFSTYSLWNDAGANTVTRRGPRLYSSRRRRTCQSEMAWSSQRAFSHWECEHLVCQFSG